MSMSTSILFRFIGSGPLLLAAACGARGGPPAAEEKQAPPATAVSAEQARRTALARVPGQVIEEELEDEDGRWVWEFDIRPSAAGVPDQEVVVDATSGQIIEVGAD
jgi:uncharacterized membrane protein YkoI